jgi:hypothetical protein
VCVVCVWVGVFHITSDFFLENRVLENIFICVCVCVPVCFFLLHICAHIHVPYNFLENSRALGDPCCREYSDQPRLAGTDSDLDLAAMIERDWKNNGLDAVYTPEYYVRLSYPNMSNPNVVSTPTPS